MVSSEVVIARCCTAVATDRSSRLARPRFQAARLHRASAASAPSAIAAIATFVLAIAAPAAPQERPTFTESAEVTAFDLVADVESGARGPVSVEPSDFHLSIGGDPVAVDTVYPGAELTRRPLAGDDAWTILIWLAADLSSSYQLRWAAASLSQLTVELATLGDVELLMGDPEPRRLLPPTRDAAGLETALSRLATEVEGDDRLAALRYDYVAERTAPTLDMGEGELARAFAAEEERIVLSHQDALLLALDQRRSDARRRRLLLLVSGGFDLWPEEVYEIPADGEQPDEDGLAAETKAWRRCLAAYGWITVPVLAPALDHPLRGGFTIGKLRLFWGGPPGLPGVHGGYEEDRNPERAAAYMLLGRSLRAEGRLEDAAEAFERAIYHYYDDKKTTHEQGVAWLELGAILSQLGAGPEALAAWEIGTRRLCSDEAGRPSIVTSDSCIPADLSQSVPSPTLLARASLQGEQTLQELAATTGAFLVRERELLPEQLRSLAARPRLTFQISGLEAGRIFPVELSRVGKERVLQYARWVRSGSTERLADARLRHLLTEGPLEDDAGLQAHTSADTPRTVLALPHTLVPDEAGRPQTARLSWAWLHDDAVLTRHELLAPPPAGSRWQLEDTPIPAGSEGVVMVELLSSGLWGSSALERSGGEGIDP